MTNNDTLPLQVLNLCASGKSLKEAKEIYEKGQNKSNPKADASEPKKPTAKEKKAALVDQIEALGGEVPQPSASVAVFEQALTAAQEATEQASEDEQTDEQESDDLM